MKKALLFLGVLAMAVSMVGADAKIKFGISGFATNDPTLRAIEKAERAVVEAAGGVVVSDTLTAFSPEAMIASIERLITGGANCMVIVPTSDAMLPKVAKMCEEAQVYWGIAFRTINDPAVKKLVEASKYYVGNTFEDEVDVGYQMTKVLAGLGVKNLATISIPKGDTTADRRFQGIEKAAKETGMKLVGDVRNVQQAADGTKAVESLLATHPEMDGVFIVASIVDGILPAVAKGLDNQGRTGKVKVGRIDFTNDMTDLLKSGTLNAVAGGHTIVDPTFATAMVINAAMGHPLSPKPYSIFFRYRFVTDAATAANYFKYTTGEVPIYTVDEIRKLMLKAFNPGLTIDSFQALAASFSLEDLMKRHQGLVK